MKASMDRIIENLADGLSGRTNLAGVMPLLDHFWENRRLSRTVFGPPIDALVRRWLSDAIELKLLQSASITGSAKVAAIKSSAGAISLLEQWMSGHLDLPREAIGEALVGAPIA